MDDVIRMILHCPQCGLQHIDEPDERTKGWQNPPHRSHLCHGCKCIWRPADIATEGVRAIETVGKADTWSTRPAAGAQPTLSRADQDWVLVPRELTPDMLSRAAAVDFQNDDEDAVAHNLWNTLISVVPHAPSRGVSGAREAVTRMADECRQRAIAMVKAQRRQWFCSGDDCTEYDHGRDEGFDLAMKALGLLAPFTDEVSVLLSTLIEGALEASVGDQHKLAEEDARLFGSGFLVNGRCVDPREVTLLKPAIRNRGDQ